MKSNLKIALAVGILLAIAFASEASAATRFAAPGGIGLDPCASAATPCSIFTAADSTAPRTTVAAGDTVVLAPGNYSDLGGDLGPRRFVGLKPGITLRGLAGLPRPVIVVGAAGASGGLLIGTGNVVSHLEIIASNLAQSAFTVEAGTVSDVIARSSAQFGITCRHHGGTIRDSVCLSTGPSGIAVGSDFRAEPGLAFTASLRNVTAVSTGNASRGVSYSVTGDADLAIDAVGVLARGSTRDVVVGGFRADPSIPGGAASVGLHLERSAFSRAIALEEVEGGGTLEVTPPGSGTNIVAAPLLGPDGYHQLPGSPTVDAGPLPGDAGVAIEIDGEPRTVGIAADIGADELVGLTTTTRLTCAPPSLLLGGTGTCTATVVDTSGTPVAATGSIEFGADSQTGSFGGNGACALVAGDGAESSCRVDYLPKQVGMGVHPLIATYRGDALHASSRGSTAVMVSPPASPAGGGGGAGGPAARIAPQTTLAQKPRPRTAKRLAVFTFAADQGGSRFECRLDRAPFKSCRSPFKKRLGPGSHRFQVRAVNGAGIADPTPVQYRWKILAN